MSKTSLVWVLVSALVACGDDGAGEADATPEPPTGAMTYAVTSYDVAFDLTSRAATVTARPTTGPSSIRP